MSSSTSLSSLIASSSSTLTVPSSTRLQSLYTFTSAQSSSNPEGYAANVRWWSQAIEDGLRDGLFGDRLQVDLTGESFVKKLEWQGFGRPKGIAGVIKSLLPPSSPPALFPHFLFLSSPTSPLAPPSLTSRFIARPLWWALGQINPFAGDPSASLESEDRSWKRLGKQKFVHLGVLEEAASSLLAYLSQNPPSTASSRLLTLSSFRANYSQHCFPGGETLSEGDCEVMLVYLRREKGVLVKDEAGKVFKMVEPEDAATSAITEADRGIVSILNTLSTLDSQILALSTEITTAQTKAGNHLRIGQKAVALSYLRSKKQLEGILEKRIGAAEQLRTVLRSIDGAHGDIQIMAAYETSSRTLQSLLKHPSLHLSHIDEVTLDLSRALADQQEISDAITTGGQSAVSAGSSGVLVDEADLEEELKRMVEEEKKRKDAEERKLKKDREERKQEEERQKEADRQQSKAQQPAQAQNPTPTPAKEASPEPTTSKVDSPPTPHRTQPDWAAIDAAAEEREREERIRAGMERLGRDERRVAAE